MPDWPLNIPHKLSAEQEAEYEALADAAERGELETRPPTKAERVVMERAQAQPVTISIERTKPDEFEVGLHCWVCGVEEHFDQTAPKPWAARRDRFIKEHQNHRVVHG